MANNWNSVGNITVTTAGTAVQVTATRTACQTVFFQALQANTGKIWVCDRSNPNKTTGVGVLAVIPAPTLTGGVATTLPHVSGTIPTAIGALNLAGYWIDSDNDGEGCLVSYIVN